MTTAEAFGSLRDFAEDRAAWWEQIATGRPTSGITRAFATDQHRQWAALCRELGKRLGDTESRPRLPPAPDPRPPCDVVAAWLDLATIREQEWRELATGRAPVGIAPDRARLIHGQWRALAAALERLLVDMDTNERP